MRLGGSKVKKFVCETRHVCAESFAQSSRNESASLLKGSRKKKRKRGSVVFLYQVSGKGKTSKNFRQNSFCFLLLGFLAFPFSFCMVDMHEKGVKKGEPKREKKLLLLNKETKGQTRQGKR